MADIGIRDYLKGKGYNDNEITYNNGNVMLKGKQFYGATPKADGSTYGDTNALNNAFNSYNMNDALDTFKTNLNKPRAQFAYDPNSDQAYQSALQAAGRSAQTAGNNATVALGARGIGNSQQALTTENQIQQRSVADVNSNILPGLINQAYGRFHDQQVMNDQNNDRQLQLAGTYNNLGQQDFNNDRLTQQDERQTRQDHIDLANMLSQQYGVKVDPKDDPALAYSQVAGLTPLNMREFQANREDATFNQGIQNRQLDNSTRSTNASIANMGSDNARAGAADTRAINNDALRAKYEIWDRTGKAPAGIPGVAEGTSIYEKPSAASLKPPTIPDKESTDNLNTIMGDLGTKGVTKDQATKLVQANRDNLSDADYKKAMDYIQKEF